jgi:predicted metal-binding membrane protein
MRTGPAFPLARERNLILALLLVLSAASWFLLIRQASDGGAGMMDMTMGMNAPLFLALWVVMMVAVMFPPAAPMILTFATIHESRRQRGQSFVPTWLFAAAYLLVWSSTGIAAYALALSAQMLGQTFPLLSNNAGQLGGGLIVLAGLYQLSPLKYTCLSRCRSPLGFVMTSWRDGYLGAIRMGIEHGIFCLGCCWLLFLILFPLGVMNVGAMAAITLLIFAEKALPVTYRVVQIAAVVLVICGALVIWMPQLLPTYMPVAGQSGGM